MGAYNSENKRKYDGEFITILADGKFHKKVTKETPGAVLRKWESKDGKEKGEKWELTKDYVIGKIESIFFEDSKYGRNLLLSVKEDSDTDPLIITLDVGGIFGRAVISAIPNIDMSLPIKITAHGDYVTKDGKEVKKGVWINQGATWEISVRDYFQKWDDKKKNFVYRPNVGYPLPPKKYGDMTKFEKDDYFPKLNVFLCGFVQKLAEEKGLWNKLKANETPVESSSSEDESLEQLADEFNADSIPF